MISIQKFMLGLILLCLSTSVIFAQEKDLVNNKLSKAEANKIIKKVTENEDAFRIALTNYVFNRDVKVQTIGLGGLITGTYLRNSFMTFKSDGQRFEKILYAPISTLTEISVSPEDIEDLGGVTPFAINPRDVKDYNFRYIGKQQIDEINTYVFDVEPRIKFKKGIKKTEKRYFIGRIWVDDRDLLIVKSKGKGYPEVGKQRFPIVETWRNNIDGKHWFPVYSSSDDELIFDNGNVVKLRMRVRYENYKQGRSDVTILDDEEIIDDPPVEETKKEEPPKKDD